MFVPDKDLQYLMEATPNYQREIIQHYNNNDETRSINVQLCICTYTRKKSVQERRTNNSVLQYNVMYNVMQCNVV